MKGGWISFLGTSAQQHQKSPKNVKTPPYAPSFPKIHTVPLYLYPGFFVQPTVAIQPFPYDSVGGIVVYMEFRFILVEPSVPENVGFVARALKTLGFHSLALVNSELHKHEKTKWVAHGSWEILEQTAEYPTVEDAVKDLDFIVATTARRRTLNHDYHTPKDLRRLLQEKEGVVHRVGLLFGREESGLTNTELAVAHCVSSIPLSGTYPSLNLAQAVLVYAYELSPIQTATSSHVETRISKVETFSVLRARVQRILRAIGLEDENLVGKRLVERLALLSASDLRLVHSLCARIENVLSLQEEKKG